MKKLTAVEWLMDQFIDGTRCKWADKPDTIIFHLPIDALKKAKEMEKKQIIEAFNYGNGASNLAYGSEYFKNKFKK